MDFQPEQFYQPVIEIKWHTGGIIGNIGGNIKITGHVFKIISAGIGGGFCRCCDANGPEHEIVATRGDG